MWLSQISATIHEAFGERQIMYPLLVGIGTIFGAFYVLQYGSSEDEDDPWFFMLYSSLIWDFMCLYTVSWICWGKFWRAWRDEKVSVEEFDQVEREREIKMERQQAEGE